MILQTATTTDALPLWQRLVLILIFFAVAWLASRLGRRLARRLSMLDRFATGDRRPRPERLATLQGLLGSAITLVAAIIALLSSLSLFVAPDTLVWMVGLFSAAFGLGARPFISDYLNGIGFIFNNTYDVGEKVELPGLPGGTVEGVIEAVNLRTTLLRAPSGEPYVVPNGEIRVIRNFSRGRFSTAEVTLRLEAEDLGRALPMLESLGQEALELLPNLLEPWHVISSTGELGQHTELTLLTKARFGKAAEMKPRLLALIQERLAEHEIDLAN